MSEELLDEFDEDSAAEASPESPEDNVGRARKSSIGTAETIDEGQLQVWIAAVVDHDQKAFEALYDALSDRVYGLALKMTRRAGLAEEITEDTFWQVWRQAPRFDPQRGSALAWLFTIARSRALDAIRALDPDELFGEALEDDLRAADDGDPVERLDTDERRLRVHAALGGLEPVPRQLVALAYFRGLSHEEIADIAAMPLGTVKSHIRRALIHLRRVLAGDDPRDEP